MKGRWVLAVALGLVSIGAWLSRGDLFPGAPLSPRLAPVMEEVKRAGGSSYETKPARPLPLEFDALLEALEADAKRGLATLVALVDASDPDARLLGIHALHGRPEPAALGALGRALHDPDADIRWAAFRVVADMAVRGDRAPDITRLLERALSDPDPALRTEAVDTLAQQGAEGLGVLEQALADPAEEVRERAAALLEAAHE